MKSNDQKSNEKLSKSEREGFRQLREENRKLRMDREILKYSSSLFREGESMRFAFIDDHKEDLEVVRMCKIFEVSRSVFYS